MTLKSTLAGTFVVITRPDNRLKCPQLTARDIAPRCPSAGHLPYFDPSFALVTRLEVSSSLISPRSACCMYRTYGCCFGTHVRDRPLLGYLPSPHSHFRGLALWFSFSMTYATTYSLFPIHGLVPSQTI